MIVRLVRFAYGNARARALLADFWGLKQLEELAEAGDRDRLLRLLEQYCPAEAVSLENADTLLAKNYLRLGANIADSLPSREGHLIRSYLRRVDVENLKVACRALVLNRKIETYQQLLHPVGAAGKISPEALQRAGNVRELGSVAASAGFYSELFSHFPAAEPKERDLQLLELDLDRMFWDQLSKAVQALPGQDRKAAGEILGLRADSDRFNLVHRGWQAGLDPEDIIRFLPPLGTSYGATEVRRIFKAAKPEQQIRRIFPLHQVENPLEPRGEVALLKRLHRRLRNILTEPAFDISLPLAVVLFKELEKQDLQLLAAGVRVGQAPQRIKELMITVQG